MKDYWCWSPSRVDGRKVPLQPWRDQVIIVTCLTIFQGHCYSLSLSLCTTNGLCRTGLVWTEMDERLAAVACLCTFPPHCASALVPALPTIKTLLAVLWVPMSVLYHSSRARNSVCQFGLLLDDCDEGVIRMDRVPSFQTDPESDLELSSHSSSSIRTTKDGFLFGILDRYQCNARSTVGVFGPDLEATIACGKGSAWLDRQ